MSNDVTRDCGLEYYSMDMTPQRLTADPEPQPIKSDGGPTAYYELPDHATELRHLISYKGMSFARGNLFKACYRLGEKHGTDIDYDLNKMQLFIDDMREMIARGEVV